MARMPLKRASVAVTLNIALRPRSGDLIVMNAGLAKPIPQYLLYSMAAHRAGLFALLVAAAFVRISMVQGTYRRDNWSRSRPVAAFMPYCAAQLGELWLGPRLIRELDQHLPQLARPGHALWEIQPQGFAASLQIEPIRITTRAAPIRGLGAEQLGRV